MMKLERTNPELWEACKVEAVHLMGKFSARAMQRAVVLYKQRGGGYKGAKNQHNKLVAWGKNEKLKKNTIRRHLEE